MQNHKPAYNQLLPVLLSFFLMGSCDLVKNISYLCSINQNLIGRKLRQDFAFLRSVNP